MYIEFTMLTVFKCRVQWHSFTLMHDHHYHPSLERSHYPKLKLWTSLFYELFVLSHVVLPNRL